MGEHVCTTGQMVYRQVLICRISHQQSFESRTIRRNVAYDPERRDDYRDRAPRSSTSHPEAISRFGSYEYRAHSAWSQRQCRGCSASDRQALQYRTTTEYCESLSACRVSS